SGVPVANVAVSVQGSTSFGFFERDIRTDGSGHFTFFDIPAGLFTLRAFEPNTGAPTSTVISVVKDQTTTQNLSLIGLGTVQVQIFADNVPFASTTTDSNGLYTITQVVAGRPFTLRAFDPRGFAGFRALNNNVVPADGATLTVNAVIPAQATVHVIVQQAGNI